MTTIAVARLQAYLRHSAQQRYQSVSVPYFTLFFHPTDALTYFNYAIPDGPCFGDLAGPLSLLRSEFARRGRRSRLEFIAEFAPWLAPALQAAGFAEEARQPFMVCTAESYRPASRVPGLAIAELDHDAAVSEVQDLLTTQRRGFDARATEAATETEAREFLNMMGAGRAFVARLEGEPVGAGMYTAPLDRVTEITGLATLELFRRRGIGTALAARAVQSALQCGAEVICLTAADERAGRVYERVGFARCATMLAYIDDTPV